MFLFVFVAVMRFFFYRLDPVITVTPTSDVRLTSVTFGLNTEVMFFLLHLCPAVDVFSIHGLFTISNSINGSCLLHRNHSYLFNKKKHLCSCISISRTS